LQETPNNYGNYCYYFPVPSGETCPRAECEPGFNLSPSDGYYTCTATDQWSPTDGTYQCISKQNKYFLISQY